jgi:hypothetical protein
VTVRFNEAWGREEPVAIPGVDAGKLLKEALEQDESWGAQLPTGVETLEALASQAAGDKTLLVHPMGSLEVRQSALPLAIELQTVGGAPIAQESKSYFDIERVVAARKKVSEDTGEDAKEDATALSIAEVKEDFARGQFITLTDSERLTLPAFEEMKAGASMGTGSISFGAIVEQSPDYETTLIGEDLTSCPTELGDQGLREEAASTMRLSSPLGASAAALCELRRTGRRKYAVPRPKLVKLAEQRFQVIDTESAQPIPVAGTVAGLGRVQAEQALSTYLKTVPERAVRLEVVAVGGVRR